MAKRKAKTPSKSKFPRWAWGIVVAVLLVIVGLFVVQQINSTSTAVTYPDEISVAQASQRRDQGAFILDVREPAEWVQIHIPGATLVPLGDLPSRLQEVPKDRDVIVVCRTGHRSAQGRDVLRSAGYTRVTSMAGGVTEWQAQGLPITSGE